MKQANHILFISLIILAVFFSSGAGIISIKLLEILIFSIFCVFIYTSFQKKKAVFKKTSFDLSILSLFVFSTVNYIINYNSFFACEEWIKITSLIVLFYLLVNFIESGRDAESFINIYLFFVLLESVFAVSKRFYFGELRLTGTFASPNFLMGFLLPLSVFIPDKISESIKDKQNIKIAYYSSLLALILVSLIYSQSRMGLIMLVMILLIWVYRRFGFSKWFFGVMGIFLVAIFFTPNMQRLLDVGNRDVLSYYRLSIWDSTIRMIKENFWGGVGLGNYKNSYLYFRLPIKGAISQYGRFAQFAHNEFLELGATLGFTGIVTGLLFIKEYISSARKKKNDQLTLSIYLACGLIIFQSFFDYNIHHPGIAVLFVFLLACREGLTSEKERSVNIPSSYLSYILLVPVMMFIFFVSTPAMSYYETKKGFYNVRKGDVPKASEHFVKAIEWTPGIAPVYTYLADVMLMDNKKLKGKKLKIVEELYQQAIYYEGDNPVFYAKLANYYYNNYTKKFDFNLYLASAYMEKSFLYDPYNAFRPFSLAKYYLESLKLKEAEAYFLKSVELEPNFLGARIYLDYIYNMEKESEKSMKNVTEILRIEKLKNMAATDFERKLVNWSKKDAVFLERVKQKEIK